MRRGLYCIMSAYSWLKEMIYDPGALGESAEATEQVSTGGIEVDGVSLRPFCQPDYTITINSNSKFRTSLDNFGSKFGHILWTRRVGWMVGECVVPFTMYGHSIASKLIAKIDHEGPRDCICAVDHDLHTA